MTHGTMRHRLFPANALTAARRRMSAPKHFGGVTQNNQPPANTERFALAISLTPLR